MMFATSTFIVSLLGMAVLFSVKYRETKTGRIFLPALRDSADEKARMLKDVLMRGRVEIERLPPILMILIRNLVRVGALRFAASLKFGEEQAYRLADLVSYKHCFERRETRSEFLRQVSDHKNGGGQSGSGIIRPEHDEITG